MLLIKWAIRLVFALVAAAILATGYFAMTPVQPDNVVLRVSLICHAYQTAARLQSQPDFDLAWARHIDCGCMREQLEQPVQRESMAAMLEALRKHGENLLKNAFTTNDVEGDVLENPALERGIQSLTLKVAMCQRPFG